jgi:hypothetical protein
LQDWEDFSYLAVAGPPTPTAEFVLAPNPATAETNLVPQRQQHQYQQQGLQEVQQAGLEKRVDKAQYREQAAMIQ